jgi:hypothetical protein
MNTDNEGRWVPEPPTVLGWCWWRSVENDEEPRPVYLDGTIWAKDYTGLWNIEEMTYGEWYTIPIQEPPK